MVCTILQNTAICHILAEHTNMSSLIEDYKNLGLFQTSKVDGLSSGSGVRGFDGKTKSLEYFTTGFGQGSSITTLQLLRGYSAFANDGRTVEPYLVEKVVNPTNGKTLYSAKTSYSKKIYSTEAVAQIRTLFMVLLILMVLQVVIIRIHQLKSSVRQVLVRLRKWCLFIYKTYTFLCWYGTLS